RALFALFINWICRKIHRLRERLNLLFLDAIGDQALPSDSAIESILNLALGENVSNVPAVIRWLGVAVRQYVFRDNQIAIELVSADPAIQFLSHIFNRAAVYFHSLKNKTAPHRLTHLLKPFLTVG